uniref:Uncharacterized protein n=1 Tax=Macrostomum lignano TaxID=282301 RepID=A0A1I8FGC2_9PLAT
MPPAALPGESSTSRRCRGSPSFDFLMDESHGLIKDTEYFVALSGLAAPRSAERLGFAKVHTAWQQGGANKTLVCHHRGERRSRGGGGLRHCGRRHEWGRRIRMQNFDGGAQLRLRRFQGLRRRVSSGLLRVTIMTR